MDQPAGSGTETRQERRPSRRVVLDIAAGLPGDVLSGTAQVDESAQPQPFWGALDLMRILERAAQPADDTQEPLQP